MVSNMLSDRIERFILNQLKNQTTPVVILKRKEVAELLDCAPSQVTYVINTRFSPDRRFQVESRGEAADLSVFPSALKILPQKREENCRRERSGFIDGTVFSDACIIRNHHDA